MILKFQKCSERLRLAWVDYRLKGLEFESKMLLDSKSRVIEKKYVTIEKNFFFFFFETCEIRFLGFDLQLYERPKLKATIPTLVKMKPHRSRNLAEPGSFNGKTPTLQNDLLGVIFPPDRKTAVRSTAVFFFFSQPPRCKSGKNSRCRGGNCNFYPRV